MKSDLKTYGAPWEGTLVLACRKCQKKLKGDDSLQALAKLKKTVKRWNKNQPESLLQVIQVGCMDLCPKGGVTVCVPGVDEGRLRILRGEEHLSGLAER